MSEVAEATAPVAEPAAKPAVRTSVYESSKELVVHNQGNAAVPMPATFAQMQDFASTMARAGAMVGAPFRDNPGACLGILTQAMRWGMDPYAVSQKAYVASRDGNGPIAYEGQLVAAVVAKNAPLQKRLRCTYSGDGDDRRITITGFLDDEPEAFEYTSPPVQKLKKEKGKGSPLWHDDPDQQLWYYGVRAWARKWCPDVIMGVYTPDEVINGGTELKSAGESAGMSLVDDTEVAKDAEFTPVDALFNKGAAQENAAPKDGAKAMGDSGVSGEPDKPKAKRAKASESSAVAAADPKAGDNHTQQAGGEAELSGKERPGSAQEDTDTSPADADREDAELVAKVEADVKAAKTGKREIILAARGALTRISETAGDEALRKRADALLNKFDLDA